MEPHIFSLKDKNLLLTLNPVQFNIANEKGGKIMLSLPDRYSLCTVEKEWIDFAWRFVDVG